MAKCTKVCNNDCLQSSNEHSCCEGGDKCDCSSKLKIAKEQAIKDNGMRCLVCNAFCQYAEPNRCNGDFICFKCRDTSSWKLPKGKWLE